MHALVRVEQGRAAMRQAFARPVEEEHVVTGVNRDRSVGEVLDDNVERKDAVLGYRTVLRPTQRNIRQTEPKHRCRRSISSSFDG